MKTIIILILTFFIGQSAFANGGVLDASSFRKTKNIRLLQKGDISLLREDLRIKIEGDYTIVRVDYTLRNNGEAEDLLYGFPVDAFEGDGEYLSKNPFSKDAFGGWESMRIVEYFKAFENGKPLKVSDWVVDTAYTVNSMYRKQHPIYRKWHVLELFFEAGETKTISIDYKVDNWKSDGIGGFKYIDGASHRDFTYHLTPSSGWGGGIVGEFNLDIDLSDIKNKHCDYRVEGVAGLRPNEKGYACTHYNYDLKRQDRLFIRYYTNHLKQMAFMDSHTFPKGRIKSIRASSDKASVQHLLDGDPRTHWTGSTGDWIEIDLALPPDDKEAGLRAILALNGQYSSYLDFENAGRVKNCSIMLNDSIPYNTEPWDSEQGSPIILLTNPRYKEMSDMRGNAIIIAENDTFVYHGYDYRQRYKQRLRVTKVRITVHAVHQGFAHPDKFTISELYLLGD